MQKLTYEDLKQAVSGTAAGIRTITRLEPLGGPADKLYPPTFGDAVRVPVPVGEVREERRKTKYALEWRRIAGTAKLCVVLDSVASQANRMEVALLDGYDRGELRFQQFQAFTQVLVAVGGHGQRQCAGLLEAGELRGRHQVVLEVLELA